MRNLGIISYKCSQNELSYFNQENCPSHGIENVSIIIVNKKRLKNRKKHDVFIQAQQTRVASRLSRFSNSKKQSLISKSSSMPELNKCIRPVPPRNRSGHRKDTKQNKYKQSPFQSNFIVNVVSEHRCGECLNPFYYPRQTKLKIYRCQLGATDDTCCCSCNSDAMFEVMKSLYECYKKKNCENCNCILCGHLQQEDRKLGEKKKSLASLSEQEKILRAQAMKGLLLPEGKTASEKKLIDKVRTDLGVPIEPKTKAIRDKHEKAAQDGKLLPLEGKTPAEKEKILKDLHDMDIPLPVGRTPSEKALIAKIMGKTPTLAPSGKMRRSKAEESLTTLKDKTPEEREKILNALANRGKPLPEGQTPSEKKLIKKVRADLGLPIEPKTKSIRDKHEKAAKAGLLQPLEGKTPAQKEKILKRQHDMGIPLPKGRTPSEKSLIEKIVAGSRHPSNVASAVLAPSEKTRKPKAEGLLTPLKGKSPEKREKFLKALAMKGLPLPKGKSPSEKKLINKIRHDLGLPVEPKTKAIRNKHAEAANAGLLQPLEGKTPAEKEKILKGLHDMDIPLPEGRTPSEKSLIAKVAAGSRHPSKLALVGLVASEQMRRAKAEGLLTPLKDKTPEEREKILRALANRGIPLPEGQSPSETKLINKVRTDLGLPIEPKNKTIRDKHEQAALAGLLLPLEGKTPAQKEKLLRGQHNMGIPLPVGRTPSEKSLIAKIAAGSRHPSKVASAFLVPSKQMQRAKAEGLLTPLKDKTPEQREKILRALAKRGIPLPEGQSPSEKNLIDKVRADLGLPIEPKTKAIRNKHEKAALAGLLLPLEGKTPAQKEKILRGQHKMGIPLPVGRTPSEKSLIAKVMTGPRPDSTGKIPSKAISAILAASEQMRRAKGEGLLTPLKDKTPEEREKILRALANRGIPLPEGQSPSETKLINKVRTDLGLPIEPKNKTIRDKHEQAALAGLLLPLEGKTPAQKEKLLLGQHNMGIPLPVGRTPSEKSLIAKIAAGSRHPSKVASAFLVPSKQMQRAKAEGLLTPLKDKTPEQREKILRALAKRGIPLPEGQSPSEKNLIDKVRADLGLPIEPKTKAIRNKHEKAALAGLLLPLEGKTPAQKEKILRGQHKMGIPLPVGRTPSEKSLIAKVMTGPRPDSTGKIPSKAISAILAPSEQMRRAKGEGLLTPLKDKTPEEREKILRALANRGIPLPGGQSPSETKLINKVRTDLGLPIEPKNKTIRDKHEQAALAGLLLPLEGKTPAQKEKLLLGQHNMGIPLPVGRTPSEKSLIAKIAAGSRHPSKVASAFLVPSKQMQRAKAEGLLTPLKDKTPEQREKILRALAKRGIPLPEGQSPSEKNLIDKVRADLGLPIEPKTKAIRNKHEKAALAGLLLPLEGKTPAQKEKILRGQHKMGIPLPVGRTPSEKSLIAKVMTGPRPDSTGKIPSKAISAILAASEQMRRAKGEGLLTPLKDKTPEEREKILRALANRGIPLPGGQSPSETKLINKVRTDLGLPIEPKNKTIRDKHEQAALAGLLLPLEGKTPAQKEKLLLGQHNMGIPLPVGRTPSEKSLIAKIAAGSRHPSKVASAFLVPSKQMQRAKAEGLLTPLKDKTPEQREKILRALAKRGIPLPEGQSPSEKNLIDKVRADLGLPIEPKTKAIRNKHEKAALAGLLLPLEGKTPAQKEKILRGQHKMGIPLPVGRTPSEKSLIAKVMTGPRPDSTGKIPSKAISAILAASEQMRRAKGEGLLTPLKDKTPEEREKILRALANRGIPLPEGQSPSETKLINKVRTDLGLPIEPKNKTIRDKHEQAALAGLLLPLEGKTPAQKEKLLLGQHNMGIPLPVGRTPSEKSLIAKIAAGSRHPSKVASAFLVPSKQMQRAKAEGLLTPLKDKTPEQREKILRALAKRGIPLPEGQSPSEKNLISKVRADLGLPIEPKTKAIRDKHEKAALAGLLLPLEGKTPAQKKEILRGQHKMGIPLPVGRTPSEQSLIGKIMAGSRHVSKVASAPMAPSEIIQSAEAKGVLTPLKGKTPDQKEKILKGLAVTGLPLPEGQSPSEKKLIDKVRAELGLPKEPKTKSIRDKHEQAAKAGLLQPLGGKTPAEKEKILKGQHDMGIPLPKGRTPSEKSLIAKIAASSRRPSKMASAFLEPSEQMRRSKAAGLLSPLKDKTPEEREKILRALANRGIPLPEGQSPSEKKLINKVRTDLGLPIEPKNKTIRDKHEQAALAGLLFPLEGKTPAQKEKLLRGQHDMGIPLPQGRSLSEKSLIAKIAASSRHPSKVALVSLAPLVKMRRTKAAGLLSPLKDKTPEEREKILRALANRGIPLPEGQSPSEKKLINKVRTDLGLPIEPKNKTIRDKHEQAALAGLLLPLEGKTPAQKEKLLRGQHDMGIPLPNGRSPSEKSLIAKIAASSRHPSKVALASLAPSEQMRRKITSTKAEGLLTPLKDKTPEEREKILKALAMRGIPLPESQSSSEKKLVDKVRADLGLPIEPKTKAIREKHEQAAVVGKLLPLEGKTSAEKEKILQDLHDMSIPLPVGRTASEKSLIAKIMASPKGKSVSVSESKTLAAGKQAGIATEYQDVLKTTTCDRGCGCDKKKIRFKHSYVKIRVTSPDISSICDCSGECIPGIKSGVFIDNDGINVTVGRAVGIPSFTREFLSKTDNSNTNTEHKGLNDFIYSKFKVSRFEYGPCTDGVNNCLNSSSSVESSSTRPYSTESENFCLQSSTPPYEGRTSKPDSTIGSLKPLDDNYKSLNSKTKSAASSLDSILVIKSKMSLCSTSTSESMDIVSLISSVGSSVTSNSTHYSGYQTTDDPMSSISLDEPLTSDDLIDHPATIGERKILRNIGGAIPYRDYTISRMSQTKLNFGNNNMRMNNLNSETVEPIVLFNRLPSKLDVSKIMDKIMSKKRFLDASAIFIVVPMSDDNEEQGSSNCVDSITSIHSTGTGVILNATSQQYQGSSLRTSSFTKHDEQEKSCGKGKKFYMQEISSSNDTETMFQNGPPEFLRRIGTTKDAFCQISTQNQITQVLEKAVQYVGSDTTIDRPPCRCHKQYSTPFVIQNCNSNDHYAANVISRPKTPRLLQGASADSLYWSMRDCALEIEDKTSDWFRFPDIHTPSPVTLVMPYDVCPEKQSFPDMRTPSPVSSLQGSSLLQVSDKATSCCRSRDMRTPSTVSTDLPRAVPTCHSVGTSHFQHKTSSCFRIPDMRTPSSISLEQSCDSSSIMVSSVVESSVVESSVVESSVVESSVVESSFFTNGALSCCHLPDMRTPSTISLVIPCDVPTRPSVRSSHLPRETYSCCHLPALRTQSSESTQHLCDISTCSGSHVPLHDSRQHSGRLRHNMHKYPEPAGTSKHDRQHSRCKENHTLCCDRKSSKACKQAIKSMRNEDRTSPTEADYSKKENSMLENLNHFEGQSQRRAIRQSTMPKVFATEEDCVCTRIKRGAGTITNEISSRQPRHQASQQPRHQEIQQQHHQAGHQPHHQESQQPRHQESQQSRHQESRHQSRHQESQQPHHQASQQPRHQESQQPRHQESQQPCHLESQQSRYQASRQSKMPEDSPIEQDCICEEIDDADTKTDEIISQQRRLRSSQQPHHQAIRQSNMSKDSASEHDCNCEDIDDADTITDELISQQTRPRSSQQLRLRSSQQLHLRSSQQLRLQAVRKSKVLNFSDVKEDSKSKDKEGSDVVPNEIGNQDPCFQASWKFKMLKDFAGENNCECQQKPIDFANYGFCICQEKEARNRLYRPTDQIQYQPAQKAEEISAVLQVPVYAKKRTITKIISRIRKSISHKMYETPKDVESSKTSKKKAKNDICTCNEDKPVSIKESESHKGNEDKPVSLKGSESDKSSKKKSTVIAPKPVPESTKTSKDAKVICECKKVTILCKCNGEKVFCDCKEEKVICKCNGKKVFCGCKEEKVFCDCREEKVFCGCKDEKIFCECSEDKPTTQKAENKSGKSKSHHIVQTMPEPEPQPQQVPTGAALEVIYDGYPYEHNCGWIDLVELMRLRSELTESTSGFKACKKSKQQQKKNDVILEKPEAEIELDFEDAIKYYVGKNLELFRDLLPPLESDQEKYQGKQGQKLLKIKRAKAKKEKEKAKKKGRNKGKDTSEDSDEDKKIRLPKELCECPYGLPPPEMSYETITLSPEASEELANQYPKGMKLCLGGRGLAPMRPVL